jgi:hypothetical protein
VVQPNPCLNRRLSKMINVGGCARNARNALTPAALQANLDLSSITDRMLLVDREFFASYDVLNYRIDESRWLGMAVRRSSVLHPSHPGFAGPFPAAVGAKGAR